MVETFPLQEAAKAYERMLSNRVRFRAVLLPQHENQPMSNA